MRNIHCHPIGKHATRRNPFVRVRCDCPSFQNKKKQFPPRTKHQKVTSPGTRAAKILAQHLWI